MVLDERLMDTLDYIVEKFNIVFSGGMPIALPISREREFPILLAELGFTIGVEVGVEEGKYSETLCKANPGLHLYSVDPWLAYNRGTNIVPQGKLDRYYAEAVKRLAPYNCEIIKGFSLDVVMKFKPNMLDFVYIDGNHEFEYVINDIIQWSKIVRIGGIVSGHDYTRDIHNRLPFHVIEATHVYTEVYKISPWFVLKGDHAPSWMWVKP